MTPHAPDNANGKSRSKLAAANSWWPIALIAATGLLLSGGAVFTAQQLDREALRVDFERRTGNFMVFLQTDLARGYTEDNQERLEALRDEIVQNGITAAALDRLEEETEDSDLVRSSLFVAERVPAPERERFQSDMTDRLGTKFEIHPFECTSHTAEKSASQPDAFYPIIDARAVDKSSLHIGADMAFSKTAAITLDAALTRGYPVSFGTADDLSDLTFVHMVPVPKGVAHTHTNPNPKAQYVVLHRKQSNDAGRQPLDFND